MEQVCRGKGSGRPNKVMPWDGHFSMHQSKVCYLDGCRCDQDGGRLLKVRAVGRAGVGLVPLEAGYRAGRCAGRQLAAEGLPFSAWLDWRPA